MREFIRSLALPPAEKERLLELTPRTYLGLAPAFWRGATDDLRIGRGRLVGDPCALTWASET